MLAVDLDQQGSQFGQLGQGHAAAIDPGTRTAIGADHAAQLAILVVQFVVAQPGQGGRGVVQGELGRQFGAFGTMADHATVGAQSAEEGQGIDQQRFACAGFTGNHRHSCAELQFGSADHGEILEG